MRIQILKVQKSNKPLNDTKLCVTGLITENTPFNEQAYEMVVHVYENGDLGFLPDKIIEVKKRHYENNIVKYGMDALLKGVEISSLMSLVDGPGEGSDFDLFKKDVDSLAYSIVAKMEQETFFNNYDPENMRIYIRDRILSLKQKFNIEPK